jgi:glycosyltransferase involved in cell wall biosynthesis
VRVYEFIQEIIMKRADATIAVSETMVEQLKSKNIKSSLIENMLSIMPVNTHTDINSKPHLVFIGRLSPEKGANVLVDAAKKIKQINLSIIGDGEQRALLEKKIKDENIQNIKLLGFHSDITPFIKSADALIMPSLREGLPMTLLEAICSGIPVIGSDVGGLKSLVKQNGILVPPNDAFILEKAILIFIDKQQMFKQNAQSMAEGFTKRFSVETWCKKTIEIYKSL